MTDLGEVKRGLVLEIGRCKAHADPPRLFGRAQEIVEGDEGGIIDRSETARQQLTQCVSALETIVNRATPGLAPADVGSPHGPSWSEEVAHWRSVETRAQLFLMAVAAWDLMLCLEESTKKSRAAEAATLKDNLKQLPRVVAHFPGALLSLLEAWVGGADIRAMCQ